ncbi:MAG: hypothetical protein WDN28_33890 [Chthoniobacter sp.]
MAKSGRQLASSAASTRGVNACLVVVAGGGGEMAARGEAEDADARGIEVPFLRPGAHEAEGALDILQRRDVFLQAGTLGHAILEEHAGDAEGIEPLADFGALEIQGEDAVAAAGADDDGGCNWPCRRAACRS